MAKPLWQLKRDFELMIVLETLKQNDNDREKVAKLLDITRRGLDKILDRHHMLKRRWTRPLPIPAKEAAADKVVEETASRVMQSIGRSELLGKKKNKRSKGNDDATDPG